MISASPLIVQLPPFSPNLQRRSPNRVRLSADADRAGCFEGEATAVNGYGRRRCGCFDLYKELVPYKEAWSWQKSLVRRRQSLIDTNEDHSDMLIILQHHPVYTLGTGSLEKYLNFDIQNAPYDVYRTERGGEVTYHGPGQIIMYPIINLRYHKMDLHWYLRSLEEVVIRVLKSTFSIKATKLDGFTGVWIIMYPIINLRYHKMDLHWYLRSLEEVVIRVLKLTFSIKATRLDGFTGVWVGNEKVAAIGIRVSRWIAYHGLALNVTTDMTPFQHIVPCGIRDRLVGSLRELLGQSSNGRTMSDKALMDVTHDSLLKEFSEVFQLSLEHESINDLNLLEDAGEFQGKFC